MTKTFEKSCETRTCTYEPYDTLSRWDEDDNEIETNEPADGCDSFECSNCGYSMLYGGDGWFDEEPPYAPHFSYCPNCGFKVVNYYE